MPSRYPLEWPLGWKRTQTPTQSRFGSWNKRHSVSSATAELESELNRLGAKNPILSTNVPLTLSGSPRSGLSEPKDVGVALYFDLDGEQRCMPCDRWDRVADNIWAIAKTINALRGIDRWGAKETVKATFKGFGALPNYSENAPWYNILGVQPDASKEQIKAAYKELAKKHHVDQGGTKEMMQRINRAYSEGTKQ